MKKKAIVSLAAACAILLAGCGGKADAPAKTTDPASSTTSTTQQPTPSPAPAPAPSPAQDDASGLMGLWAYMDKNIWVQLWDDGTWAQFNELGGRVAEGNWNADGNNAVLYFDDGGYFTTMSPDPDGMTDSDGSLLKAADGISVQEFETVDKETFVGLWQFLGENIWIQLWDDDTWAVFNENGGQVEGGTWRVDLGMADLYCGDGSYYTSLSPDVGGLTDSNENSLIHADEIGGGAPADPSHVTDMEEVASLAGWWYLGGDLSAEDYIHFSSNGDWAYFKRSPGMEPTEVGSGSIVSSAGEPHAYYANSSDGQESIYFRFSPASENGTGSNAIYWSNDGYLFVWMED